MHKGALIKIVFSTTLLPWWPCLLHRSSTPTVLMPAVSTLSCTCWDACCICMPLAQAQPCQPRMLVFARLSHIAHTDNTGRTPVFSCYVSLLYSSTHASLAFTYHSLAAVTKADQRETTLIFVLMLQLLCSEAVLHKVVNSIRVASGLCY